MGAGGAPTITDDRVPVSSGRHIQGKEKPAMSTKLIFGGAIAAILLGLYVYLVGSAISVVSCTPQPACLEEFTKPMASAMALIGGLVSALVIAELAITKPGEAPVARAISADASDARKTTVQILTFGYLAVWTLAGLAAFVVGLRYPDVLESLTALGQSWLGLAVAAGYAYFGISPR
jgi:hypothetical protein